MRTLLQVLSEDERAQVHDRTVRILANTGIRVDSTQGRRFLGEAGAQVNEDTHIVRIPRELVEQSLSTAPKDFVLGARRPGCDLKMNGGECTLLIDGEDMFVLDRKTGDRRLATHTDWLETTRLIDAMDEIGLYWSMVELPAGSTWLSADWGALLSKPMGWWTLIGTIAVLRYFHPSQN